MRELAQPTAGETARSLQEAIRLFAGEAANLPPSNERLTLFAKEARALVTCLETLVSFLDDEGKALFQGHDQWIYEIDTAVMVLDQVADARCQGHDHVVEILMYTAQTLFVHVRDYADVVFGIPLNNTLSRYDQDAGTVEKSETIH